MAAQAITTTRRVLMRALPFFPFIPATALAAASEPTDPVLEALEIYAQARANYELAEDEHNRIEEEHHDICYYRPRVQVARQTTFGYGDFPDSTSEIYVYSESESARYGYKGDKAARIAAALKADRERHEADLQRIGYVAADAALDAGGRRLSEAEALVLNAVPATDDGAVALAHFAAKVADDGIKLDELGTACRTLGDWLIARRRARLEA